MALLASGIWGFIYLGTDPVPHLGRGGGGGGDGKKGVFPSSSTETELRELCLEGKRESDARHGYF